ncbi:hypothetical protein A2U01_0076054, partial [Trifolium medium]|nr:hypothetical protein [Trifolium medium]
MKAQFRQFVYPENQVNTKGAPKGATKRASYSHGEYSMKHSPSLFEHLNPQHPDTPVSQSSCARKKCAWKSSQSRHLAPVAPPKRAWPN